MKDSKFDLEYLLSLGKMFRDPVEEAEGRRDPTTLASDLLRVRDRNGHEIPLLANKVQLKYESERTRQNVVVKARQMGMTSWIAGRFFLKTITARGVLTVQVAQTMEAAESIFRMVQRFWVCLPEALKEGPLRRSRANVGQMVFPALDSEFRILSAANENAGRGLTIQNLHCSEVAHWPGDAAATLAGLRAALSPTGELVLESTANGAYGCFYDEWMQAEERGARKHFFPWWMEEAYVSRPVTDLREDELLLMRDQGLSAEQIGFRRGLESSYRGLRTQEFAEDATLCFRTSGDCCFDVESIEGRLVNLPPPVETRRGGALQIWLPPVAQREYLIAVDTAGGGSEGDFAAVQVIDLETGMQCAELQQRLTPMDLSRIAASLAREYGGAMIAVERNNHGSGMLAYLDAIEQYPRVYEQAGVTGWLTTAASKPVIVGRLGALLIDSPSLFSSKRLLQECRTFVSQRGGSTAAAAGCHDDCLMSMAIAQAVRAERLQTRGRRIRGA